MGGGGTVGSGWREFDGGGGLVQPSVGNRTFKSPPCGLTDAVVLSCCLAAFRCEGKNAGKRLRSNPIIALYKGFSAIIGIPPSNRFCALLGDPSMKLPRGFPQCAQ
jgi:hypothetical protein